MSALPPKADIGSTCQDVRFVPKADIDILFDDFVGNHITDCIFGHVDLASIERASISGRGILNLVKICNGAIKHMRKDLTEPGGEEDWGR